MVVLVGRRAVDVVVRGSHGVLDQLRGGWERLGVAPVQRGVWRVQTVKQSTYQGSAEIS